MVQLKKKAVLLIGALMLLLGMGMNLQYALGEEVLLLVPVYQVQYLHLV